ncbi:retrotransposon protein, putative, ty1-copia subclass [Tanacetum coccineum]|uniref:Retrotransposon protein, putative, ty1-copia subclass n=1 Tax=Tanacetum coccineum TaxID=301880 RepID=A0ABQ4ZHM5_9ASTR
MRSCMCWEDGKEKPTTSSGTAKDLLGLIHTDVCGPFNIVSRQGASYFVTFTDDFSRYGYVYLLKHKHEVFETFKVFQKEVENQLGKTIKSLRSDRGGEYMSQEFLDHLKDHGIIAHRTPPYIHQHNGVRKGETDILDLVSIYDDVQTTLPKSYKSRSKWESKDLKIIQEEDTHPSIDTSLNHGRGDLEIDELIGIGEPSNYKVALLDPESAKWLTAMNCGKMQSMKDNEVWILVDSPNGKRW